MRVRFANDANNLRVAIMTLLQQSSFETPVSTKDWSEISHYFMVDFDDSAVVSGLM